MYSTLWSAEGNGLTTRIVGLHHGPLLQTELQCLLSVSRSASAPGCVSSKLLFPSFQLRM